MRLPCRPAVDPARLAVVTILQFVERLSDAQAADVVRSHIDWKYLLALPLTDPGFDASVLREFRTRLLEHAAEGLLFDLLLTQFRDYGLLRARGRQRTDSTHVLVAVRTLNRLGCVAATMRHALNSLAVVVPEWLFAQSPLHWADRYGPWIEEGRLPEINNERLVLATQIGADGLALLRAIGAPDAPVWLRTIPAVVTLWTVWIQNYTWADPTTLRWRTNDEIPPAGHYIGSPYNRDARYSIKRQTSWVGYEIHLTESVRHVTREKISATGGIDSKGGHWVTQRWYNGGGVRFPHLVTCSISPSVAPPSGAGCSGACGGQRCAPPPDRLLRWTRMSRQRFGQLSFGFPPFQAIND